MNVKHLFLFLLIFSFLVLSQQIVSPQGINPIRISDVSYYPTNPKVFDHMNVTVEVENNLNQGQNLRLTILVLKDGLVDSSLDKTFYLDGQKKIIIPFSHYIEKVGSHEMVFKLYTKESNNLLDTKILNTIATSELGPFDLSIDTPDSVKPGMKIPITIKTANNRQIGSDIDLKITIKCSNQRDIVNEFVFYLDSMKEDQRVAAVNTCEKEEGLHSAYAEMIFYNRTLLSAISQFYTKESSLELFISTNQKLEVTSGSSQAFDVNIRNPNNVSLENLNLIISNIPSSWYDVNPSRISKLAPNESGIFIVNFHVPTITTSSSYPITIYAASSQLLSSVPIDLKINNLVSAIEKPSLIPTNILIIMVPIGLGIIGVLYLIRKRKGGDVFLDYELSG